MTLRSQLTSQLVETLDALGITFPIGHAALLSPTADIRFGDYQTNVAMLVAKRMGRPPRQIAEEIAELFPKTLASVAVAGPGFVNFSLHREAWNKALGALLLDARLGVPELASPQTIVVDFSAPNVAKPMHVGHIRSTIIGDSLARIAEFVGHRVIRDNHIGDWGTQFGMILYGMKHFADEQALNKEPVSSLLSIYRKVNALCEHNPSIRESCKQELVALQAGDEQNLAIWRRCVSLSRAGLEDIYKRLDVRFDYWLGESYYNDALDPLVKKLCKEGIAKTSEGAICVFFEEEGLANHPTIVQKADGGFLYATTDLATIDYRVKEWKADAVWYVVGAPQQLHFQQIFAASSKMGHTVQLEHIAFGSILGKDRKLMKTRSGDNIGLLEVLNESVQRADAIIGEKNPAMEAEERQKIAEIVGLGSVKFAELSQHRMTDYIFDWDRMLALQGDTAPYLQYSSVRIASIFSKLGRVFDTKQAAFDLQEAQEIQLARMLTRFAEVIDGVLEGFRPNLLATYLLELARSFHSFFEACPVLQADSLSLQESRLALCSLTDKTLKTGLQLLGISVPQRM